MKRSRVCLQEDPVDNLTKSLKRIKVTYKKKDPLDNLTNLLSSLSHKNNENSYHWISVLPFLDFYDALKLRRISKAFNKLIYNYYNCSIVILYPFEGRNLNKIIKNVKLIIPEGDDYFYDNIRDIRNITELNVMNSSRITDEDIKELHNLQNLYLDTNSLISDEGIKHLTELRELDIPYNKTITDEGLENLTKLTSINLTENYNITDEALFNLPNLQRINLTNNHKISYIAINDLMMRGVDIKFDDEYPWEML